MFCSDCRGIFIDMLCTGSVQAKAYVFFLEKGLKYQALDSFSS